MTTPAKAEDVAAALTRTADTLTVPGSAARKYLLQASALLLSQKAELDECREALEPFAKAPQDAWRWDDNMKMHYPAGMDDTAPYCAGPLTYGDLRRAAALYEKLGDGE